MTDDHRLVREETEAPHLNSLFPLPMLFLILLHPLHHPRSMMLSELLLASLRLHGLLQLEWLRHIQPSLYRGSCLDRLQPFAHRLKTRRLYSRPLGPFHPRETRDIRDAKFPAHHPQPLALSLLRRQSIVQHAVQPLRLRLVSIDRVRDFLRRVPAEMVRLALHGPDAALEPYQPRQHFPVFGRVVGEGNCVRGIVFLAEIELHRGAFEHARRWRRGGRSIHEGRDTAVGWIVSRMLEQVSTLSGYFWFSSAKTRKMEIGTVVQQEE